MIRVCPSVAGSGGKNATQGSAWQMTSTDASSPRAMRQNGQAPSTCPSSATTFRSGGSLATPAERDVCASTMRGKRKAKDAYVDRAARPPHRSGVGSTCSTRAAGDLFRTPVSRRTSSMNARRRPRRSRRAPERDARRNASAPCGLAARRSRGPACVACASTICATLGSLAINMASIVQSPGVDEPRRHQDHDALPAP